MRRLPSKPTTAGPPMMLIRRVDGLEQANAKTVQVVEDALDACRMQERADEQSEIIRAVVARLDTSGEQ